VTSDGLVDQRREASVAHVVRRLADQGIPEQADRAGPFGPHSFFVMAERHLLLLHDSMKGTRVARLVDQTALSYLSAKPDAEGLYQWIQSKS
jgi:hypothetical protein